MPKVLIQNDVQSRLNESLTEYLKFVDKEREEIRRQRVATAYAHKQNTRYAGKPEARASQGLLALRLNRFAAIARLSGATADKKSPSRSRLLFLTALQS